MSIFLYQRQRLFVSLTFENMRWFPDLEASQLILKDSHHSPNSGAVCRWGFHTWRYPNSWMFFLVENPIRMDDDWGYPYGNLQVISMDFVPQKMLGTHYRDPDCLSPLVFRRQSCHLVSISSGEIPTSPVRWWVWVCLKT